MGLCPLSLSALLCPPAAQCFVLQGLSTLRHAAGVFGRCTDHPCCLLLCGAVEAQSRLARTEWCSPKVWVMLHGLVCVSVRTTWCGLRDTWH